MRAVKTEEWLRKNKISFLKNGFSWQGVNQELLKSGTLPRSDGALAVHGHPLLEITL